MKIKRIYIISLLSLMLFFTMFFGIYSSMNFGANIYSRKMDDSQIVKRILQKIEKNNFDYSAFMLEKQEFLEITDKKIIKTGEDEYQIKFFGTSKNGDSLHEYEYEVIIEDGKIKNIKKL